MNAVSLMSTIMIMMMKMTVIDLKLIVIIF